MKQLKTAIVLASLLLSGQAAWGQNDIKDVLTYNTEGGYYEISDASDLGNLAEYVNFDNDCEGLTFKVTADIQLESSEAPTGNFEGIGYVDADGYAHPFKGTFDGCGHTISNVVINQPGAVGVGLFGALNAPAIVRNVKLSDCSFTGNINVGAIAGEYDGASNTAGFYGIENCETSSSVSVNAAAYEDEEAGETYDGWYAGGIIGYAGTSTVKDCISAAAVHGDDYVGGITGQMNNDPASVYGGKLSECYYTGSSVTASEGAEFVGQVIGLNGDLNEEGDVLEGSAAELTFTILEDDSDATVKNSTRLSNYAGQDVDITLPPITLYKDNCWNTLCLPFDYAISTTDDTDPLFGAQLMTLSTADSQYDSASNTMTLAFEPATSIEAGKPYLIRWEGESGEFQFSPTKPEGVTLDDAQTTTAGDISFVGSYASVELQAGDQTSFFIGANNEVYYPSADMTINPFHAYLKLEGSSPAGVRAFILKFPGDESTGISCIKDVKATNASTWYTLDGQALKSQPEQAGIYINNGRKIAIK